MRKLFALAAPLVALGAFTFTTPAHASTTIHLDVDLARAAPLADCDVAVPAGSDVIDVLDQAQASGCIDSYSGTYYAQYDSYLVDCINDICTTGTAYWALYVGGEYASGGANSYNLPTDGNRVEFSYEAWPASPLPRLV